MLPKEMEKVLWATLSNLLQEISTSLLINGLIRRETSKRYLMLSQREFPTQPWSNGIISPNRNVGG
jgi:hypothetical protein